MLLKESGASGMSWCSVVPKISERLLEDSDFPRDFPCVRLTWENSPLPVEVENPQFLGQDRLADAIGASLFFQAPYIVADMGTALTIDFVDRDGKYRGGVIAPGMRIFSEYLKENAAQLSAAIPDKDACAHSIGKNTLEAVSIGCVGGFCKLVDGLIKDIENEYFCGSDASGKTIFTGGSLGSMPKKWLAGKKIEPNLAELGLALSFLRNNTL